MTFVVVIRLPADNPPYPFYYWEFAVVIYDT